MWFTRTYVSEGGGKNAQPLSVPVAEAPRTKGYLSVYVLHVRKPAGDWLGEVSPAGRAVNARARDIL